MNKRTKLLMLALLAGSSGAIAANPIPLDPSVRKGTLPNGLTYYIRHNEEPKGEADFFIAQRVGSVNEEENQRGLAHFLEHMCFNGSKHFPGNSVISYLESVGVKFGANLNAYTSTDETVYNISEVPVKRQSTVDSCLLILRDWSGDLTLDPKEIDAERGVIKGEYRQRNSGAQNRLLEKASPVVYGNSIYGRRLPIGLMSVIDNFKPKELEAYYRKWYFPGNQCIVVVGDIDVDRVEKGIRDLWSDFPKDKMQTLAVLPKVDPTKGVIATVQRDKEQQSPSIQIYFKHGSVAADDENTIAAMQRDAVRDMVASMLVDRIDAREELPDVPFSNVGVGDRHFLLSRGQDALMIRANTIPGREIETVNYFAGELKRAADRGFQESELQRAKIDLRSQVDTEFANRNKISNTDYARQYVDHYLNGGPLPSKETWCKMMRGVIGRISIADANAYIREVVDPQDDNVILIAYLPDNGSDIDDKALARAYESVDAKELPDYVDNVSDEPILAVMPTRGKIVKEEVNEVLGTKVWTLSNGAKVHLRHNDDTPDQIYVKAWSPGGFSMKYDPSCAALYQMTNEVLAVSGYGSFSSARLRKRLAGKNVKTAINVDNTEESVEAATSPIDLETALQVLYLKLTDARKDTVAFRNLIESRRAKLRYQNTNPTFAMGDSIHTYVYGRHPFGAKVTLDNIDSFTYDDVMDIYHDRFSDMSDFTFYVTGNFDEDSLRNYAERYIASLPGNGRLEKARHTGYGYTKGCERHDFQRQMQEPQTICYTFYNSPSEYNLRNVVLGNMLGQVLRTKLLEDLRESRGWTYGIKTHAGISAGMDGGTEASVIMPVYIRVQPQHADETFDIVAATVDRLAEPGFISQEEVVKVKSYMEKNYNSGKNDNGYWLTVMHMYDKFEQDMHSGYLKELADITPADLAGFARAYLLNANRMQLSMGPE